MSDFIAEVGGPEVARVYTDAHPVYKRVDFGKAEHASVDHKAEEWVRGDVHTNSVESVWSLFKRSVLGSYHQLSEKHLQSYLDEMFFRFNRCKASSDTLFLDTLRVLAHTPSLKFKELTNGKQDSMVVNG